MSVLLPVRDAQRTLPRAIQSVQDQTLPDWELIIINDGSTDGSQQILQSFAERDARIRIIQAAGRGIVAALNEGIRQARAEFIARMDADDVSHPKRLESQLEFLRDRPQIGLVSCGVKFGGDPVHARGYALHVDWLNSLVTPEAIMLNRFIESPLAHPPSCFENQCPADMGAI